MKKYIPLTRPSLPKLEEIKVSLNQVLESGMVTESRYVHDFEQRCRRFLRAKHAVATANGTGALMLTLKCLNLKGEVILPSFTYSADAHAILWNGLKPVFADVDPETYCLDPEAVEKKITKKTAAILPTHVFGNPCDIQAFEKLGRKYKIKIIYDAAHAFGSKYRNHSMSEYGDAVIYSFTPSKVFTTGEGGLVTTKQKELADKIRVAKFDGDCVEREKEFLGLTSRFSEFQAIIGLANLKRLKSNLKNRLARVNYYKSKLRSVNGLGFQKNTAGSSLFLKDFTITIEPKITGFSRDQLIKELAGNGIESKIYFYPALHRKKVYEKYKNLPLPVTNYIADRIISLPLYSHMPFKYIDQVCDIIYKLYKK